MSAKNEPAKEFQRIRRRYRDGLPPVSVVHRDIDRLTEVAEAAKAALEESDSERVQRLYDAVVVVLKDA